MPIKWKKSPQIHVSFLSDAPGERNAVLLLHFLERGSGQGFIIKRKLRGVATSSMEKARPQPSKPPPGSKASNRRVKQSQTRARQPNNVQVIHPYLRRVTECLADIFWVNSISDFPYRVVRRSLMGSNVLLVVIEYSG